MTTDSDLPNDGGLAFDSVQIERANGTRYRVLGHSDDHIFKQIASTQDFYEREVLDAISYLPMGDGDIFVDVGANIGNHTVFFAGPLQRHVYAFEPERGNLANLSANLDANGLGDRVQIFDCALGSEPGAARLEQRIPGNSGTFYTVASNFEAADEVEVNRLDDLLVDFPVRLGLLKIDVEGAEISVLDGAETVLRRDLPYVVVEAHDGLTYRRALERLVPHGYSCIAVAGWSDTYFFAPSWSPAVELRYMFSARQARLRDREVVTRLKSLDQRVRSLKSSVHLESSD